MNRTENILRNLIWGVAQKMITLFIPFLTRTALIKVLGAEYLGLSSLFTSVLTLLGLAELGVSNAIISSMYKPIADGDEDTISALMNFYKKAYHVIGIVISIIGIAVTPFLKYFIKGDIPQDVNLYVLYFIYLINTVLTYFLFAYKNCLFIAHQRNDINSRVSIVTSLAMNTLQLLLVLIFRNYYFFVIVIPVCSLASNLITACLADRAYPQYKPKGELPVDVSKDIRKRVAGMMLGKISGTIRSAVDSLFVSAFIGLTAVAMYNNYFYIVTAVIGFIQLLEPSMVAAVGNSIATDTVEKNYKDIGKFTFGLQWIVGWCSICILCLIQPFMQIWMGSEYMFNNLIAVLCATYLFVVCICLVRSIYTQALGMWWQLRYISLIDIFVNIILNWIFVANFGVYGIIGATIVDIIVISIPWTTYYLFRDYFGLSGFKKYIWNYAKYFLVTVVVGAITYYLCDLVIFKSQILLFIVKCCICLIVPNIMYLIIYNPKRRCIEIDK